MADQEEFARILNKLDEANNVNNQSKLKIEHLTEKTKTLKRKFDEIQAKIKESDEKDKRFAEMKTNYENHIRLSELTPDQLVLEYTKICARPSFVVKGTTEYINVTNGYYLKVTRNCMIQSILAKK